MKKIKEKYYGLATLSLRRDYKEWEKHPSISISSAWDWYINPKEAIKNQRLLTEFLSEVAFDFESRVVSNKKNTIQVDKACMGLAISIVKKMPVFIRIEEMSNKENSSLLKVMNRAKEGIEDFNGISYIMKRKGSNYALVQNAKFGVIVVEYKSPQYFSQFIQKKAGDQHQPSFLFDNNDPDNRNRWVRGVHSKFIDGEKGNIDDKFNIEIPKEAILLKESANSKLWFWEKEDITNS